MTKLSNTRIVSTEDCWLYGRELDTKGYGRVNEYKGGKTKSYKAHRVMYENLVGEIPEGLVIDHLCRVPTCINPDHLEPVTIRENCYRSPFYPGNVTHCPKGHEYTEDNIVRHTVGPHTYRRCKTCRKPYMRSYMRLRRQQLQERKLNENK